MSIQNSKDHGQICFYPSFLQSFQIQFFQFFFVLKSVKPINQLHLDSDVIVESGEISLESELEAESIDCKETIKLEIKPEIQETEGDQDPLSIKGDFQDLSTELSSINEMSIEEFKIKDSV